MSEIMVKYDDLRRYCENKHCGSVPLEYIKQMLTIEAEPVRHGRWMMIEPTISLQSRWKCNRSKCGGIVYAITDYCPYCGARMDGGADNADN